MFTAPSLPLPMPFAPSLPKALTAPSGAVAHPEPSPWALSRPLETQVPRWGDAPQPPAQGFVLLRRKGQNGWVLAPTDGPTPTAEAAHERDAGPDASTAESLWTAEDAAPALAAEAAGSSDVIPAFVPALGAGSEWVLGQSLLFEGLGGAGWLLGSVGVTVVAAGTGSAAAPAAPDTASDSATASEAEHGEYGEVLAAGGAPAAPASATPVAMAAQPAASPPHFVFETERSWNENTSTQTVVYDVNARDLPSLPVDRNIRYTLAGPDAAFFSLDVPTGELRFVRVPDVEADQSADGDRLYEVWVSAADLANNFSHMRLTVELLDLEEDGVVLGSAGADLMDANYLGDPNADRIDDGWGATFARAANSNLVRAGAGDDTVYAGLGNDTIDGGAGNDLLFGGAGDDAFVFHDGDGQDNAVGGSEGESLGDVLDASALSSPLSLAMSSGNSGFLISTNGSGDQVGFSEIERFVLGLGNDLLSTFGTAGVNVDGGAGDDLLNGGAGADTLAGGEGNDSLYGGAGNDQLAGGAGSDRLEGGGGDDLLRVGAGDTALGGLGEDRFTVDAGLPGDAGIVLAGGAGDDVLDLRGLSGVTLVFDDLTSGTAVFRNSANQTVNIAFSQIELVQTGALPPHSAPLDAQAVI